MDIANGRQMKEIMKEKIRMSQIRKITIIMEERTWDEDEGREGSEN